MSFVTPLLLAGAGLVVVPIVLHLLMRRKPREIEFPALRLVRQRHETNRSRMRLRHLLLLLLRAGAISLLALSLARPSVKLSDSLGSIGSQEAPVAAALVFDCAPRMEYRQQNQTRLQAAAEMGLWLLAQLPPESRIAVVDTKPGASVFQIDRAAARERIERLQTVPASLPLAQVVGQALRLVGQSELPRKEVYVFTDLTRAAWPQEAAAALRADAAAAAGAGIYLIDVGVKNPVNFSLGQPQLSAQVLSANSPLGVDVELSLLSPEEEHSAVRSTRGGATAAVTETGQSDADGQANDELAAESMPADSGANSTSTPSGRPASGQRSRSVELFLLDAEGQPQKAGQRSVELDGPAAAQLQFVLGPLDAGTHQGFLRIVGQDALTADDNRCFSVDVKQPWRVLIVSPDRRHSHAAFLEEMISPASWRRSGQARFECDAIKQRSFDQAKLERYAAVCLLDPKPLAEQQWRRLADYATSGGGVAVFLGRNARPLDSFNRPAAQEVLAGPLVRQARAAADGVILAPQNLQHPILSEFQEISGSIPWNDTPVFRYWELASLAEGAGVVARYSDGRPAIIERHVGDGLAITMTTPISDSAAGEPWNLLPVADQWPFLILTNRLMLYLVGSTGERLNYLCGQTAVLALEPDSPYRSYLVGSPDGFAFSVPADPQKNFLAISATDQPGNYRVRAGGRVMGFDSGFSVNLALRQTDLRRADRHYMDELFGPLKYRIAENREQVQRDVDIGRVGRELFGPLILLVAVILGGELLLANRFYRELNRR